MDVLLSIVDLFEERYHLKPRLGKIDITLYRDDLYTGLKPALGQTSVPFSIDGRSVVLIDGVLFTGRTVGFFTRAFRSRSPRLRWSFGLD